MRPFSAPKPEALPLSPTASRARTGEEISPGIKLADPGLASRLQAVANEFPGKKLFVISGYRPQSNGSYHKLARALDFRVDGVKNEQLVTFCRSLPDTGCGYYPNSVFVHMDVRPPGTGHVYWIDASGPGEHPRYVASWPPPKDGPAEEISRPDHAAPNDEQTHEGIRGKAGHGIGESDRDEEATPTTIRLPDTPPESRRLFY